MDQAAIGLQLFRLYEATPKKDEDYITSIRTKIVSGRLNPAVMTMILFSAQFMFISLVK